MPSSIRGDDNFDSANVVGGTRQSVPISVGTPYTNSTNKPQSIVVSFASNTSGTLNLTLGGVNHGAVINGSGLNGVVGFILDPGESVLFSATNGAPTITTATGLY